MIQAFQKFSQSRIAKIFLAIVALSFVAFFGGGGDWFRSRDPNSVVARVGDVSISRYDLAEKVHTYAQRMAAQSGESPTKEQLLESQIPQMILWSIIHDLLLDLEAKHLGLTVNDETLRDRIQSIQAFQNEDGEFVKDHFIQVLRNNGLSEETFIAQLKQELIREQLTNAVMVGAYLPDEMVNPLFDAQYQHRQASMVLVSPKDMPAPSKPTDDILEAFYKKYQKEFKTPELRTLTLLVLDPTVIAKGISVTDEDIKLTYEAKPETYGKKKLADVKPLILAELQKEKAIEEIHKMTQEIDDKIAGGATLEEVLPGVPTAQLIKLTEIDGQGRGRLEDLSPQLPKDKDFAQEILTESFKLDEGMDSPFIQAKNGTYFTIRVDKIIPTVLQPFAAIKDRVLKKWTEVEQFKMAYTKAEKYTTGFNQGHRAAALMTLLPNLSLSEPSPTVPNEVKNLVYSLHKGQAGMTRTPKGFAVVVLNKIIPPTPKVKEEKMASFKESLFKSYQQDLLMSYINALRVRYPVKVVSEAIAAMYAQ